jgi:hypothetical protein
MSNMYFIISYNVINTVLSSQVDRIIKSRWLGENKFKI